MKRTITLIVVSLMFLLSVAACATPPAATITQLPPIRSLSSSGIGEVYLTPDVAYVYVGVRVEADDVATALANNNVQANAVSQAVQDLGVDIKDIQTTSFNVYPNQEYGMDGTITRKFYVVENTVFITVRDLGTLGGLLDAVVSSGANSINGISFDVEDKDAAAAEARDIAIEKAKLEAESIAAASGVKLGDLQNVSVYVNGTTTPMYDAKGGGGAYAASSVPVSAGQLVISASANLMYEIK
jgi:uncharacterized protein YggE